MQEKQVHFSGLSQIRSGDAVLVPASDFTMLLLSTHEYICTASRVRMKTVGMMKEMRRPRSLKDCLLNQANMFSGGDPLPQNWVRVLSRGTGQMYYANVETGVTQSEKLQSVTLCHQGLLGRQQSHPLLQGNVHAGSQNNTEVGQCLSSFEAPALQVRDSYRVSSQANLSATGKNGYKQKSQLKRMFLRWMRRVYGLYKVPSKRASATVSAFVI